MYLIYNFHWNKDVAFLKLTNSSVKYNLKYFFALFQGVWDCRIAFGKLWLFLNAAWNIRTYVLQSHYIKTGFDELCISFLNPGPFYDSGG